MINSSVGGVVKVNIFYVDLKIAFYFDKNDQDFKVDIE